MTNEKLTKNISQWDFDFSLFTNLPRIIITCDFSPSSFKLKRGILPLLTKYPSLKTTYHIKLIFFLCSKPLYNLLLAKCLIPVNAPLLENFICLQWWLRLCPWFCSGWFYLTLSMILFRLVLLDVVKVRFYLSIMF